MLHIQQLLVCFLAYSENCDNFFNMNPTHILEQAAATLTWFQEIVK